MSRMTKFIMVGLGGISLFTFIIAFLSSIGRNIAIKDFIINWAQLDAGIIGFVLGIFLILLSFGWAMDGEKGESIFSYYKKIFIEMKKQLED